jgi:uncharacterized protein YdhG (YjbR/CyaY superfamily)
VTAEDVDRYLEALPADQQAALRALRSTIERAVPEATLGISYRIPTFKLRGHPLVGFGAATAHCSFFVMSTTVMPAFADRVTGYDVGKGTVRFAPDARLPDDLVEAFVAARVDEIDARWPA